jgi:hypothetical protein
LAAGLAAGFSAGFAAGFSAGFASARAAVCRESAAVSGSEGDIGAAIPGKAHRKQASITTATRKPCKYVFFVKLMNVLRFWGQSYKLFFIFFLFC